MTDLRAVVVGYDGSSSSLAAVEWGAIEASLRGVALRIVTADPVPSWNYAEPGSSGGRLRFENQVQAAVGLARHLAPAVTIETALIEKTPNEALVAEMATAEVGVLGRRGLSMLPELVVGSTSLYVAAHASCPVVVLRACGDEVQPGTEAGRVVVGVDGSAFSAAAITFAFAEAELHSVGLTAVHAWSPYVHSSAEGVLIPESVTGYESMELRVQGGNLEAAGWAAEEVRLVAESLAGYAERYPAVDVRHVIVETSAERALIGASAGASLVVVGSRGTGAFDSLVLGSTSYALLHHAHSAVAIVRVTTAANER